MPAAGSFFRNEPLPPLLLWDPRHTGAPTSPTRAGVKAPYVLLVNTAPARSAAATWGTPRAPAGAAGPRSASPGTAGGDGLMEVFILTGIHLFSRTLEKYRAGTCGCVDIIARDMSKLKKKKVIAS